MSANQKEETVEKSGPVFNPPVYIQRYSTVRDILIELPSIEKVVDFGCADGKFIKYLKKLPFAVEIACVDLDENSLDLAVNRSRPLSWDFVFKRDRDLKVKIFKGSALENDCRLQGYSAVTCIELIEHLQPADLQPLASNIFGYIRPKVAVFTTPNCEFNVLFPNFKGFRHWDHKFEWTRKEFEDWCNSVLDQYPDYSVEIKGVGDPPPESSHVGPLSQLAVFTLNQILEPSKNSFLNTKETYVLVEENCYPGQSSNDPVT